MLGGGTQESHNGKVCKDERWDGVTGGEEVGRSLGRTLDGWIDGCMWRKSCREEVELERVTVCITQEEDGRTNRDTECRRVERRESKNGTKEKKRGRCVARSEKNNVTMSSCQLTSCVEKGVIL